MSKVFISYRRDDSAGYAHAIYRELLQHFSNDRLFMDVDTVEPGVDFVRVIEEAVGKCDVLVALIGKRWLGSEPGGTSRLENEKDYVRLEVSTALARGIRVIPVLVDGMTMPREDILPAPLQPLTRRNAIDISNTRFSFDVERVINAVRKVLDEAEAKRKTDEAERRRIEQVVPSPWRTYAPAAAGVAVVLILFSFVFWWPKPQEAPLRRAEGQKESIKEAPLVKQQPQPKEMVASAPEKKPEAKKEILTQPPVVKTTPEKQITATPQKKVEEQKEAPPQAPAREPKQEKPIVAQRLPATTRLGRVTDLANALSDAQSKRLADMLERFERADGIRFDVLTVPTVSPEGIEEFSIRVFNARGFGKDGQAFSHGAIVVVSVNDQKASIRMDLKMPYISNADAQATIDNYMVPNFRKGLYAEGLEVGLKHLIAVHIRNKLKL
jgi:TPM domain/TIR domain